MWGVVVHDSIPLRGLLTQPATCGTGLAESDTSGNVSSNGAIHMNL
jgi:hypothetical protein